MANLELDLDEDKDAKARAGATEIMLGISEAHPRFSSAFSDLRLFPPAIKFIVWTEFCERFSYFGLKTILLIPVKWPRSLTNQIHRDVWSLHNGVLCHFSPGSHNQQCPLGKRSSSALDPCASCSRFVFFFKRYWKAEHGVPLRFVKTSQSFRSRTDLKVFSLLKSHP